jgi:hypothetical protein
VPADFPQPILPEAEGLIVADAWDATILRDAAERPMNATRRRTQILRFGLTASSRLHAVVDPRPSQRWNGG